MKKNTVKNLHLGIAFCLILCATCFSGCVGEEEATQVDSTVHEWMDTEMTNVVTGDTFTLRGLTNDGTPIVVHIFATWCPACNAQLVESTKFLATYPGKAHIVAIDIDTNENPAFIAEHVRNKEYNGIFATAERPVTEGLMGLFGQEIMGLIPQTVLFSGDDILYLGPGVVGSEGLATRLDAMQQQLTN